MNTASRVLTSNARSALSCRRRRKLGALFRPMLHILPRGMTAAQRHYRHGGEILARNPTVANTPS